MILSSNDIYSKITPHAVFIAFSGETHVLWYNSLISSTKYGTANEKYIITC